MPEILIANAAVLHLTRRLEGGRRRKNAEMMADNTIVHQSLICATQGLTKPLFAGMSDKTCYLTFGRGILWAGIAGLFVFRRVWSEVDWQVTGCTIGNYLDCHPLKWLPVLCSLASLMPLNGHFPEAGCRQIEHQPKVDAAIGALGCFVMLRYGELT